MLGDFNNYKYDYILYPLTIREGTHNYPYTGCLKNCGKTPLLKKIGPHCHTVYNTRNTQVESYVNDEEVKHVYIILYLNNWDAFFNCKTCKSLLAGITTNVTYTVRVTTH